MPGVPSPAPPTGLTATAGVSGQLSMSWIAPSSGSAHAGYQITQIDPEPGGVAIVVYSAPTNPATSTVLTGLTNGVSYTFYIQGITSGGGYSSNSTDSTPTTVRGTPPNPVTSPSAVPGSGQVVLSWTAPASGETVEGYQVYDITGGGRTLVYDGSADPTTTATITGLTNGTTYSYVIDSYAVGADSTDSSTLVFTPSDADATVPDVPTSVSATATADGQITVSWATPDSDGGSPITGYAVYQTAPGSRTLLATVSSVTTSYIANSLTEDVTDTFVVDALNAIGSSDDSPGVSATPTGPVSVSWTASPVPLNCKPVTSYTVVCTDVQSGAVFGTSTTDDGSTLTTTFDLLTYNRAYNFTVTANNPDGSSASSESVSVYVGASGAVLDDGSGDDPTLPVRIAVSVTPQTITWDTDNYTDDVMNDGGYSGPRVGHARWFTWIADTTDLVAIEVTPDSPEAAIGVYDHVPTDYTDANTTLLGPQANPGGGSGGGGGIQVSDDGFPEGLSYFVATAGQQYWLAAGAFEVSLSYADVSALAVTITKQLAPSSPDSANVFANDSGGSYVSTSAYVGPPLYVGHSAVEGYRVYQTSPGSRTLLVDVAAPSDPTASAYIADVGPFIADTAYVLAVVAYNATGESADLVVDYTPT